jgi:DNA-directed RNA polymerase specialized sigma24 family protein
VSRIDRLFGRVCEGDRGAFEGWLVEVEMPLRGSLGRWARAVDVESVMQETLLRMWLFALERGRELEGKDASLRWAIGMARNLARNDARRFRREHLVPVEELPEQPTDSAGVPDPALREIIRRCLERVTGRPAEALRARLEDGSTLSDRTLAEALGMKLNTFRQNLVRARRQVASCLSENGAPLEEVLP